MSTVSNVLVSSTETGPSKLTVGKIFGGMLILENWKLTKFSAMPPRKHLPVSLVLILIYDMHFDKGTNFEEPNHTYLEPYELYLG